MDRFSRDPVGTSGASRVRTGIQTFMANVYGWMTAGLFVTGSVAYFTSESFTLLKLVYSYYWFFVIAQLGLVWFLSARINQLSSSIATIMFLVYSTLTGLSLSGLLLVYTSESVASVFLITAGTFGVMSAYGYLTKADLSSWGNILFMGLIGLIIASLANVFWLKSSGLAMVLPYFGVLIFVALTAYDTNMLRRMGEQVEGDEEMMRRYSIIGALHLYLDFINLFIYLLRILGNRR